MSAIQEFLEKFVNKQFQPDAYLAEIVSVQEITCTVKIITGELEVEGVKLVADESFGMLIKPKVGSLVVVGLIESQISDLCVLQHSEVDSVEFKLENTELTINPSGVLIEQGSTSATVTKDEIGLSQGQTNVTLKNGKVEISNQGASLKDLFADLITLLNSFSVITSVGPSAGLNPATITLLIQLQTKVNLLLQ